VGDRVSFEFAGRTVEGVIIEDRGKIGFQGARLLTVRVPRSDDEDLVLELPADRLKAA
jgi:hypothetical protein